MANTIAGVSLQDVAITTVESLRSVLAPIRSLFIDITDEVAAGSSSIVTRIPTRPTAQDLSSGYTKSDVSMSSVTVTLSNMKGFVWGFTDYERSRSAVQLNELFVQPATNALAKAIFNDIKALITSANFSASYSVSAANMDRTKLADLAAQLTKALAPKEGRAVMLAPDYMAGVVKSLFGAEWPGVWKEKAEFQVPRTAGFDVYETSEFIGSGAGGAWASGDLAGFAFEKSAIVFAARRIAEPQNVPVVVEVEELTVPDIGLPVQFRRWYDANTGSLNYSVGILYGVAVGNNAFGIRITAP